MHQSMKIDTDQSSRSSLIHTLVGGQLYEKVPCFKTPIQTLYFGSHSPKQPVPLLRTFCLPPDGPEGFHLWDNKVIDKIATVLKVFIWENVSCA